MRRWSAAASRWAAVAVVLAVALGTTALARAERDRDPQPYDLRKDVTKYTERAEADRVVGLPGAPQGSQQVLYSGFLEVDQQAGRELFYVLAEADEDAENKPLVLWLNGGPGCSSVGGGFMTELGPYYPVRDDTCPADAPTCPIKLVANDNSWTREANVIFLDSPALVGFSRSSRASDNVVGDARTARDALRALLVFTRRFPVYSNRPFYVAGESYGGHYVPNLAAAVVAWNKGAYEPVPAIPGGGFSIPFEWQDEFGDVSFDLRGALIGNPWTVPFVETAATLVNLWSRGIISDASLVGALTSCDMATTGPVGAEDAGDGGDGGAQGAAADILAGMGLPPDITQALRVGWQGDVVPAAQSGEWTRRGEDGDADFEDVDDAAASEDKREPPAPAARDVGFRRHAAVDQGRVGGVPSRHAFLRGLDMIPAAGGKLVKWVGDLVRVPKPSRQVPAMTSHAECQHYLEMVLSEMGPINIYDIYVDVCRRGAGAASDTARQLARVLGDHPAGVALRGSLRGRYDPCVDSEASHFLNQADVQRALHVPAGPGGQAVPWTMCNPSLDYSRDDLLTSMLPVYRWLLKEAPKVKLFVFSGDVDGIIPVLGTRVWVRRLMLKQTESWGPWYDSNGQVGGYRAGYGSLWFSTVRNAGHMVPYTQPERSVDLLRWAFEEGAK
ncbi:unnamed protein product [Pedinophyceae sp. YPF-701]|nr:unnamed protein product [Pedinophyceae sp. YPF-701]